MASRWLPNIEGFFNSYCRVLIDGGNLMNVEDDRADFFARRIDEHEQTVRTLAARLLEAVPGENNLHENIVQLLEVSSIIRARLQDRSIERENRETEIHSESYRAPIERTGSQGRPRFSVSTSNAHDLRQLGFAWTDIAQMLGVSSRTLWRRRYESDSSVGSYSDIPNNELDQIIREVLQTTPPGWAESGSRSPPQQRITCAKKPNRIVDIKNRPCRHSFTSKKKNN